MPNGLGRHTESAPNDPTNRCSNCTTLAVRLAQAEARGAGMWEALVAIIDDWSRDEHHDVPLRAITIARAALSPDAGRVRISGSIGTYPDPSNTGRALADEVKKLRDGLEAVDRLRKRLPGPDFGEQQTTARAIGEVVRDALAAVEATKDATPST